MSVGDGDRLPKTADEAWVEIVWLKVDLERQRIAAYILAQLLGDGRDEFDVVLKPSVVREVAEAIREGRYEA